MGFLFDFLRLLCQALSLAILARAILSWFSPGTTNMLAIFLYRVTEPLLAPLRRIIPMFGPLDFTPMVAIIMLQIIAGLLP